MNRLKGHISDITVKGSLSLVSIGLSEETTIQSIVIETPETAPYLKLGNSIKVLFKETEVVIGSNQNHSVSLQNRIHGIIENIDEGELLSKIVLSSDFGKLVSIISTNAKKRLSLKIGDEVIAMVKLNEIMLSQ